MHYWRILIPVLAVLGSVASFAERSSIDGRERFVDRREQLTRTGPDQRFDPERSCAGKGLGFHRDPSRTLERAFYGHRVSSNRDRRTADGVDRRFSRERQHSEIGYHSRVLREPQRNQDDEYQISRRQDSRSEPLNGHSYGPENRNRVRLLRDSLSRDRSLSVDRRDAKRVERRLRTDLRREDSRFRVRNSDGVRNPHRGSTDDFRRIENERGRFNQDSDSTRQISRRTRETYTERGKPGRDEERVSSERFSRREESRNSREMSFKKNRQDILSYRVLSSRQKRDVAANDENRSRRTRTRATTEGIRHISARMDRMIDDSLRKNRGEESRSNTGEIRHLRARTRLTPESERNTGERRTYNGIRSSISRQARLDTPRSNVEVSREDRVSTRMSSGGARNSRDAQNIMDLRTRKSERSVFSRQSRIVEPREDLRERRARTRETPANMRQMSDTPEEIIRNSANRNGDRKHDTARMSQHVERRVILTRHILRERSASESVNYREIRFDARTENRVESNARTRSEQGFRIRSLANVKHAVPETKIKATRDSLRRESDINRIAGKSVRDQGSERIDINWKKTPSPKYDLKFRRETALRDTRMVLKDEPNKAQEYSQTHIGGTPMMSEWTTLAFYALQGVYVCALLYQMSSGKSSQNTKFGFGWWASNKGKLSKVE